MSILIGHVCLMICLLFFTVLLHPKLKFRISFIFAWGIVLGLCSGTAQLFLFGSAHAATPNPAPSSYQRPDWYYAALQKSNDNYLINSQLKHYIRLKHLNTHVMLHLDDETNGAEYEIKVVKEGKKK